MRQKLTTTGLARQISWSRLRPGLESLTCRQQVIIEMMYALAYNETWNYDQLGRLLRATGPRIRYEERKAFLKIRGLWLMGRLDDFRDIANRINMPRSYARFIERISESVRQALQTLSDESPDEEETHEE